jgi:hypothetical protein
VGEAARRTSKKAALIASLGVLLLGAAVSSALPASASSGIGVFVSYADSLRADAVNFPTPWEGSPQTTFQGCTPIASCEYDGGAVRIVNNTSGSVVVDAIAVHIDTCTFTGWSPTTLAAGADLIVAQLGSGAAAGCTGPTPTFMDTSDIGPGGIPYNSICTPDGIQPTVDVTIDGVMTSYTDSGQVLNTGGFDAGGCPVGANESIQWTAIGHAPCKGSLLTLTPATQTHGLGNTATLTATFTNSCADPTLNTPLSNVTVNFVAQTGPNAGRTGSGVTDINGQATITYTSTLLGTDTWGSYVDNLAGRITSNTATVTWVAIAPGAGAFVIGDLENATGGSVYWWGAQWWKKDAMSSGPAPASFKGYELDNASPWCGQTWTTRPGNSPHPPQTVPGMMAVIVSSHIVQNGPVISGDVVGIVLVQTNPGYGPNPGHPGTGTIISTLCSSTGTTGATATNPSLNPRVHARPGAPNQPLPARSASPSASPSSSASGCRTAPSTKAAKAVGNCLKRGLPTGAA